MKSPACVTDAPKPNPVDVGSSTNCGTRTNDANIPKPNTNAARFVVHTGGSRIIVHVDERHPRAPLDPDPDDEQHRRRASRPSVRAEVQPQLGPSLTATSSATSQPASSAAPGKSTRPGVLIGDSGTKKSVPSIATTTAISGNQKSQW